jgi:hypothetical protein
LPPDIRLAEATIVPRRSPVVSPPPKLHFAISRSIQIDTLYARQRVEDRERPFEVISSKFEVDRNGVICMYICRERAVFIWHLHLKGSKLTYSSM